MEKRKGAAGKGSAGEGGGMLFGALVEKYFNLEVCRLGVSSQLAKKKQLQFWQDHFGACRLEEITRKGISDGLCLLGENKWKSSTVNAYLRSLSRLFQFAVQVLECLERNPCHSVRPVQVPAKTRVMHRWLSRSEMEALKTACRESSCEALWPVLVVMLLTCARMSEVKGLRWASVNLEDGYLLFPGRGSQRRVPLKGIALEVMKGQHAKRNQGEAFCFPALAENHPVNLRFGWETAVEQAGLCGLKPSDVQATVVANLYREGISPEDLAQLIGVRSATSVVRLLPPAGREERVDATLKKMADELFPGDDGGVQGER